MLPLAALAAAVTLAPQPLATFQGWTAGDLARYSSELPSAERQALIDASAALLRHRALARAAVELPRLFVSLDDDERRQGRGAPLLHSAGAADAVVERTFSGDLRPLSWGDETDPRRFTLPRLSGRRFDLDPKAPDIEGGGVAFHLDSFPPCGLARSDLHDLLGSRLIASPDAYWSEAKIHDRLARKLAPVVTLARKPDPFGERRYSYGGYFNGGVEDGLSAYDPPPPRATTAPSEEPVAAGYDPRAERRQAPPARRDCRELAARPSLELIAGAIARYRSTRLERLPGVARLEAELRFASGCYAGAVPQLQAAAALVHELALAAPSLRAACAARRGHFEELRGGGDHVELLSCQSESGSPLGASLRWYDDGRVTAAYAFGERELTLTGSLPQRSIQLTGSFGPELRFDLDGSPALLRLDEADKTIEWYSSGRVRLLREVEQEPAWYPNGKPAIALELSGDGQPRRLRKWHPNGQLAEDTRFVQGKPHGLTRWWHDDGRVAGEANFVAGAPSGEARLYFADGRLGFQARYARGELSGEIFYLNTDGSKALMGVARDGEWDGPLEVRLNAALPLFSRHFVRGKPTGTWTDYNPLRPGRPLRVVTLDGRGLISGRARGYSVTGNLKSECRLRRTRLQEVRSFHPNGAQLARAVFDDATHAFKVKVSGVDRQPVLSCVGDRCTVAPERLASLPRPSDATLFMSYAKRGIPVWLPDACGGYRTEKREGRVSLREYEQSRNIWVEKIRFKAREPCPAKHTAALTCWVRYPELGAATQTCEAGSL